MADTYGVNLLFFPMHMAGSENDAAFSRDIAKLMKRGKQTRVIDRDNVSPQEYLNLIGRWRVFVGSRLHSTILSTSANVKNVHHKNKIIRLIKRAVEGWGQIRSDRTALKGTALWMLVAVVIQVLVFLASFKAIGVDISIWGAAFVGTITMLSSFVSITPGELGVAEAFIVVSSVAIGIPAPLAFAAALLRRISGLLAGGTGVLVTTKLHI